MNTALIAMKLLVLTLLVTTLCSAASSQAASSRIYKTVDEEGNVVFTDVPPKDGEAGQAVAVEQTNTFDAPAESEQVREAWTVDESGDSEEKTASNYQSVVIVTPAEGESVRENAGNVAVVAELEPGLQPGHKLRLMLDGKPEQEGPQTSFMLTNVDRGTHSLNIEVVSESGEVVSVSEPTTFTLHRYSIQNAPNRPVQPLPRNNNGGN